MLFYLPGITNSLKIVNINLSGKLIFKILLKIKLNLYYKILISGPDVLGWKILKKSRFSQILCKVLMFSFLNNFLVR